MVDTYITDDGKRCVIMDTQTKSIIDFLITKVYVGLLKAITVGYYVTFVIAFRNSIFLHKNRHDVK